MLENIDKKKIILVLIILIIIIGGVALYFLKNNNEGYSNLEYEWENNSGNVSQNNMQANEIINEKQKIIVDISGQVISPGVVTLDEGSRVIDAINAAGGAKSEANLQKVNLAYVLSDAQKIYIPSIKDKEVAEYITDGNSESIIISDGTSKQTDKKEEKLMININTASQQELEKLPGIGTSIAARIITYRKENGKFKSIEDIKNVSGIGDSKFNNIKNSIYVK